MPVKESDITLATVDTSQKTQNPSQASEVAATVRRYCKTHANTMRKTFPMMQTLPVAPWGLWIDTSDWPLILADAIKALARGEFFPARDHLLALYINRLITFWDETKDLSNAGVDALLDRQARDTRKVVVERGFTFDQVPADSTFSRGHWSGVS